MKIWILVCFRKEFGTGTVQTFTYTNLGEVPIPENIDCDGWHSVHTHEIGE